MRYFIGVASKNHIEIGQTGGFCQLCHGKAAPLQKMRKDDKIIYYSPKLSMESQTPYQAFTALGTIADENVYQVEMFAGFFPFRRNVLWSAIVRECPLAIAREHNEWKGYASKLRFGHFEVSQSFFGYLADYMMQK
ncbi:EVE domain-containing protein [Helicobacter sp. MIT 11-5569]|uniref:EVE domain-containing protein n=1 Tax=Helicobacter sp. MIT 11-5569 TaxID=1548151 RepID=UPI00051F9980|nr:EVE domain-containing protein [Helicobacter sp. MIT 11-5569]TLD83291.1 EVE domain-containing protein [Helicobacter sp. MIT 11-5569]